MGKRVLGNPALDYTAKAMLEMAKFGRGYENLDIPTLGLLSAELETVNRKMYTVVSKSEIFRKKMTIQWGSWHTFTQLEESVRIDCARKFASGE